MSILIKPIITEKATNDSELYNRYAFVVNKNANKLEIRGAVEAAYGVAIESVKMDVTVQEQVRTGRGSLFDQFFGRVQNRVIPLKSNSVKIKVQPLPAPKPSSFEGLVGNFKVKSSINKTEVNQNEAITYSIKVSGSGNLKLLPDFKPDFPPDFEVYDPKVKENIAVNAAGASGSKTYEYLIIPRYPGEYELPEIGISYFNPKKKKYQELSLRIKELVNLQFVSFDKGKVSLKNPFYLPWNIIAT
ncbi:50S ribosomal protein L23 [uncultured Paraglaciecola sp.]|uniref:50S ribosomal protein L23 n=1 Tax=uncultured Paraglaciecola sp. TaxID=1765024 RepID=UPI002630ADF6|nr:50S ribosomal protein L23 [uncultured Paraglaciecola sp.]